MKAITLLLESPPIIGNDCVRLRRPPHYLLTWKIATQMVEQKAMKIPGMPTTRRYFIALETDEGGKSTGPIHSKR